LVTDRAGLPSALTKLAGEAQILAASAFPSWV
jgi:hypothetical protein